MATDDGRIVDWADYGRHIPLKCKVCGKKFHTKNIDYIGARTIFMTKDGDCPHGIKDLEPVKEE